MSRYTGPRCRLCRREGRKLFLKGYKCETSKCPMERRPYPPGMHGQMRRAKMSDYGIQLREKQKVRRIYGVQERQFRRYFEEASRRPGVTGTVLLQILESRLDNLVYRMGFASSRSEARQIVRHGHILVNGRRVDIPSYLVPVGAKIEVAEKAKQHLRIRAAAERAAERGVPEWLDVDLQKLEGVYRQLPERDQLDPDIREQLIVELYSK